MIASVGLARRVAHLLALLGTSAVLAAGGSAAAAPCGDCALDSALRLSLRSSALSLANAGATIEGALGCEAFSVAAVVDVPSASDLTFHIGGEIAVHRDGMTLAAGLARDVTGAVSGDVLLRATGSPLVLYDGLPLVLAGFDARAEVRGIAAHRAPAHALALSPTISAVAAFGPEWGVRAAAAVTGSVPSGGGRVDWGSTISCTATLGAVRLNAMSSFDGLFSRLRSGEVAIGIPAVGVTVAASLVRPLDGSRFTVRFESSIAFGRLELLPGPRPQEELPACSMCVE
jgi:hypothetical protein